MSVGDVASVVKEKLLPYAGEWWFPWAVGLLSCLNTYILFLSGPLSILFISGTLARPERRFRAAFANALGATCGIASLVYIGKSSDIFPLFDGKDWETTRNLVEDYVHLGVILIAGLPIILHPMVFFAVSLMDPGSLILCVLIGRFIKYCIVAQLAFTGSKYVKLFGSSAEKAVEQQGLKKKE